MATDQSKQAESERLERALIEFSAAGDPEEKAFLRGTPHAIKNVGIVGGGTAGFFTALTLRKYFPNLPVTLIESSKIPVIGVGEATTPTMVSHLHLALGLDIHEFYREVKPTWKLGIRYEWGCPEPYHFDGPFDWDRGDIGQLGSLAYTDSVNSMSLEALMMSHGRVPIVRLPNGEILSLLNNNPFAYHLDNPRLVRYLHRQAVKMGVELIDTTVVDAEVNANGDRIERLITEDGRRLSYDLYVDCSGFRSLLLEGKLKSPFVSYEKSLITDRALAFNKPHGGNITPYTTAKTMNAGWCWKIPMPESDHLGYVFSSQFCSQEEAEKELREKFPDAGETRLVRFRSGRHEEIWRGNVFAVGNAYAFVEPLESSGILMILSACRALTRIVAHASNDDEAYRAMQNETSRNDWDSLRWFLAIHYKFNKRLQTPFWKHVTETADISGVEEAMQMYREGAPMRLRGPAVTAAFQNKVGFFYGLGGFDSILLGQKVPTKIVKPLEDRATWEARRDVAMQAVKHAVTMSEALALFEKYPEILDDMLGEDSWTHSLFPAIL